MQDLAIDKNIAGVRPKIKEYRLYQALVIKILSGMNKGRLVMHLPNGEKLLFGNSNESINAEIKINNFEFFKKCVLYGDIGFGEAYMDGDWDSENITDVISWMILNIENSPAISGSKKRFSPVSFLKIINKLSNKLNENTLSGSSRNISAHYDLNNKFFELFLDRSMTYSSGIFSGNNNSLEYAQAYKYERLCTKLNIKESDKILEIGSGWGGFAIYAARKYGCRITTVTISKEQYEYANKRIEEENLSDKIEIKLLDYRQIEGRFDKIVSIEMLEAVGHKYLRKFFKKCSRLLTDKGTLGLQVITCPDSRYDSFRKGVDWIQKHIFPGSLLPSIAEINKSVNATGEMYLHDLKNFGLDYARTLSIWRKNFNDNLNKVFSLGFDNKFARKWNYYFSYCEAAFKMRNINVVQMIYTKPNNLNL